MSEYNSSHEVKVGFVSGASFHNRKVQYAVVDGLAIFEGDIVLGTAEELARTADGKPHDETRRATEVVIDGDKYRWPGGKVPYFIPDKMPNKQRITDAIAVWERCTRVRFVPWTDETDFINFRPWTGCSSNVGRVGGQQFINLDSDCSTGNVIHEIGHALGLWHTQSREDRDVYVTVDFQNIDYGSVGNFDQHIVDGTDVLSYNYRSVMHYGPDAFSTNGRPTIVTRGGQSIGQRDYLSDGEIAAITTMYGGADALIPPLAAASWGENRLDVFGLRVDGSVEQRTWNGSWWRANLGKPPSNVGGGRFRSPLTAVSRAPDRCDVFGVGANGHVIQRWWDGSNWHWSDLGAPPSGMGVLAGQLAATSWGPDRLDVFGLANDGRVVQLTWGGHKPWVWTDLGKPPADIGGGAFEGSALTATCFGEKAYNVFGVGADGGIIQLAWTESLGKWHWADFGKPPAAVGGGRFAGPLAAASWGGRVDVFGLGVNGNVIQCYISLLGTWGWLDLQAPPADVSDGLGGSLTVASWGKNRYDVFGLGGDGRVVQLWWDGGAGDKWRWSKPVPTKTGP